MKSRQLGIIVLIIIAGLSSCKDCEEVPVADDATTIESHLAANNITAEKSDDGIYYVINEVGTGANPSISNEVIVHYKGYTLEGDIFDSSYDRGKPATFPLTNVIEGWQKGIPLFKEGGGGTLFIPSSMAYGTTPPSGSVIECNEILVFDVELIEVK